MLEDLEHNYLGELQKYRFAHFLTQSIGPTRDQIRDKSYSELTDFLENLQKVSGKIGENASGHVGYFGIIYFSAILLFFVDSKEIANFRWLPNSDRQFPKNIKFIEYWHPVIRGRILAEKDN